MLAAWTAAFWREPRFWRHTLPVLLTPGRRLAADPALREERVRAYRRRRPRQVAPPVPPADETTVPAFVRARGMHRLLLRPRLRDSVARLFHLAYFGAFGRTLRGTHWLGSETLKFPSDLWIYQELLYELRPALVVEAGTYRGGSARFLATCCDAIGTGHIVTIDPAAEAQPPHPRITYIDGSSVDPAIVERVRAMLPGEGHVMVILDSDHSRDHVLAELRVWAPLVTSGSYLVVEDTNLNGHPVLPDWGPGPAEAVAQILEERCDLVPDPTRERFLVSACPGGFLRKR
jgi:cephalosporin hydroxylase